MGNLEGLRAGLKLLVGKSVATSFSILCIFVFLVHVAFQIEFNCTCSGADKLHCWTYMVLPGVLISSITLWADKRFRSLYAFTCNSNRYRCLINSKGCCHFCCKFVMHVLKAILSGFIWVASLLLDGDWYVCCKSHPANQTYPCQTKDELSLEERTDLALQKNISMGMGFALLGVMLVIMVCSTCRSPCDCCNSTCSSSNRYLEEFQENLLEEVEQVFSKGLKNISRGFIAEKIHANDLDVLQYVPDAAETNEDRRRADLVGCVKKIDWKELAKFSFDVIDDFKATMYEKNPTIPQKTRSTPETRPLQAEAVEPGLAHTTSM